MSVSGFVAEAAEEAAHSTNPLVRPSDDPRRPLMAALEEVAALLRALSDDRREHLEHDEDVQAQLRQAAESTYRVMDRAMADAL